MYLINRLAWGAALILICSALPAQTVSPAPPQAAAAPKVADKSKIFPEHPPAPQDVLDRGRALYGVHCNFCHGSDARGGEGGPNLLRSELVLRDDKGELIAPVVQKGRPDQGMPAFALNMTQISDIAAYIHNFKVGGYDISRMVPPSILVGDAKAGQVYFTAKCAACHSVTGDLQGISTRFPDAKELQNTWIMPGGGYRFGRMGAGRLHVPPTTVTVAMANGEKVEGRLGRIDDFTVQVILADGAQRTIRRDGDTPSVVIHDPLQPHKELLPQYTDKDIHNLTSYLVTVK